MSKVAKLSFVTAVFLCLAVICAALYAKTGAVLALIVAIAFAWLGGIQLLNSLAVHLPTSIARAVHWTHAMTFEFFALIGVPLLRLFTSRETISGKGKPILLVHGYVNNGSVWIFQKMWLKKAGLGPIYTINLGHPFRSIQEYAEKVKTKAEEIALETGRSDLILIGHSMGGLVSSLYALTLAKPGTVTDIITIGSPLEGTPVACIALGPNGREMECNSKLIKQLQDAMAKNRQIRFHHIATKSDQLVIPGHTAVIADNNHFIIEDIGHASLLYSPRVTDKICEWIRGN